MLNQFKRDANIYCKSTLERLNSPVFHSPSKIAAAFINIKSGLISLAKSAVKIHEDKYQSINIKSNYVEFRSPGNDWLNEYNDLIKPTLNRFIAVLDIACDTEKFKNEYYKKLFKLLASEEHYTTIDQFAKYAAGLIDASELKSSVQTIRGFPDVPVISTNKPETLYAVTD